MKAQKCLLKINENVGKFQLFVSDSNQSNYKHNEIKNN